MERPQGRGGEAEMKDAENNDSNLREENGVCPTCNIEMTAVEYGYPCPQRWDGFSEYYCQTCDIRIGRWSGKVLTGDELEPKSLRFKPIAEVK